jgi:hypoxanthine phosphoribosyltransferase
MKLNIQLFSIIILFSLYHYFIQNGLEKTFSQTYFDYNDVKRPLKRCNSKEACELLKCIGMPSGHAETASVFFFLLYFYNFLPLWLTFVFVLLFSAQRIITNMHTISQVTVGSILGLIYASIYKYFNLSIIGFIIVFFIGFLLAFFTVYRLDQKVHSKIPNWVDKSMYNSIKNKQEAPFYIKIGSIYLNSIIQQRTFISWNNLENYLDKIVDDIKSTGIKYDAVVGIKTGGAIISDYISSKLGLPNYKIKLNRQEYNCNKNSSHTINEIIRKTIFYKQDNFTICEGIHDNLDGKSIILIDEIVTTGKTIEEAYNYLKNEKNAYIIYPTCVAFYKLRYKANLEINRILDGNILVWPWGYDN